MTGSARRLLLAGPASATGRVRRLNARTPLRVRLVLLMLVLLVAALAGSGIAASTVMQGYLEGRVDSQLSAVAQQPVAALIDDTAGTPDTGRGGSDGDGHHGRLPSAFVVEETDASGKIIHQQSNLIDSREPLPKLPTITGAETKERGTRTLSVSAVKGDGTWRVLIKPVTLSDGTTGSLMIAQSMGDVRTIVGRLNLLLLVIGAAAVAVLAAIGYFVVRASLRPLRAVERTAAAIAAGDLSRRVPAIDPRTEVGQLSSALNTMLAEIELAFAERARSEASARRSEAQMRESEAAARLSEERMRRFVADASHELRTPLTTIRGFAELYRQGAATGTDDVRRLISRIEDEAARMGVLVDDLLLLARLDQERPLEQSPVDLLAVASDAVHAAQAMDGTRSVRLLVGAIEPPPIVLGDEARLRQIIANLLTNALKHTPSGTPIRVAIGTELKADDHVAVLTVADEGPGMATGDAARVFERFYRVDPSRSRADGGTGLGLAIVSALVAGHNGTITVDTAPGAGASFRIELPLAALSAELGR